jgi:hypothetical protein
MWHWTIFIVVVISALLGACACALAILIGVAIQYAHTGELWAHVYGTIIIIVSLFTLRAIFRFLRSLWQMAPEQNGGE